MAQLAIRHRKHHRRRHRTAGRLPGPALQAGDDLAHQHLHAFAREVDLTAATNGSRPSSSSPPTGKTCDDKRQEFILLSDTLGLSMLVVALEQARGAKGRKGATPPTEATVQGPFYWEGAPELPLGSDIAEGVPRRARALQRPRHRPRGPAAGRRAARRLVRRRRRRVRHADGGRRHARARPHPHRRRRAATGSGRSGRPTTRCPTTARWAQMLRKHGPAPEPARATST